MSNKKKILLVDDEEEIVNLLETVLLKEGFNKIFKAYTGNDAVKCCKENKPDIIILDIMLPDIDGYEVCRRLKQNNLTKIDKLVLQIGELSSMIPKYIEACYPAAVDGTLLQETELKIEVLPGNAICLRCNKVFNLIENSNKCPKCGSKEWELLSGKEFMIKEIIAC